MKILVKSLFTFCVLFLFSYNSIAQIVGPSSVCAGQIAKYHSGSSGSSYQWSAIGALNVTPNQDTFIVEWSFQAPTEVSLKTYDANNTLISSNTLSVNLNAKPNPIISSGFNTNCLKNIEPKNDSCFVACINTAVTYSTPLLPNMTYSWNVKGSKNYTLLAQNQIEVIWEQLGVGYIELMLIDNNGCFNAMERCVEVIDKPTARINSTLTDSLGILRVCKSSAIFLQDSSNGSTNREWDFGNGDFKNDILLSYSYETAGTYNLILTAYNDCYCYDKDTLTVIVEDSDGPEIVCPGVVCKGDTVSYFTPESCNSYNWSVVNGQIIGSSTQNTVDIVWLDHEGSIQLSSPSCQNACSAPTIEKIPVITDSIPINGPNVVCENSTHLYYINPLPGSVYTWSIPSSLGTIKSSTPADNYKVEIDFASTSGTITLSYFNSALNCGGTSYIDVGIRPRNILPFPTEICLQDTSNLFFQGNVDIFVSDTADSVVYQMVGSDAASIDWNLIGSGIYNVFIDGKDTYCNNVNTSIEILSPPPSPDSIFGSSIICQNSAYDYSVQSLSGHAIEWKITGGTPSSASGNIVSVNWNSSGPYQIQAAYRQIQEPSCLSLYKTLSITSAIGSSQLILGQDSACGGQSLNYKLSFVPDQVEWSIKTANGGSITTDKFKDSVEIKFDASTSQSVQIRAEGSACGTDFTIDYFVFVQSFSKPTININPISPCPGEQVRFTSSAPNSTWKIETNTFNYDPILSFDSARTIPVINTAEYTGPYGCSVQLKDATSLFVRNGPAAFISSIDSNDSKCGDTISPITLFHSIQGNSTGQLYSYSWYRDGIFVSNSNSIVLDSILPYGIYELRVVAPNGCTSNATYNLTRRCPTSSCYPIHSDPNASVNVSISSFGCNEYYISNISTINCTLGSIELGIGNTSGIRQTKRGPYNKGVKLSGAGYFKFRIGLTVFNGTDSLCYDTTVYKSLSAVPKFSIRKNDCIGGDISYTFINTSTYIGLPPNFSWNFPGSISSTNDFNPTVVYPPGIHIISLTTGGVNGCTYSDTIDVPVTPIASFTIPNQVCQAEPFVLNNTSTGNIIQHEWTYGSGKLFEPSPQITLFDETDKTTSFPAGIKLVILDQFGCRDTAQQIISVRGNDLATVINQTGNGPICIGDSILLGLPINYIPSNSPINYLWTNLQTGPTIAVKSTGNYGLLITDNVGCRFEPKPVNIQVERPSNPSIVGLQEFCAEEEVKLSTHSFPGLGVNWIRDNTSTGKSGRQYKEVLPSGNYVFTLAVTDSSTYGNCSTTTAPFPLTVLGHINSPVITSSRPQPWCEDQPTQLNAGGVAGMYSWNTSQIGSSINAYTAGTYEVFVTAFNGCTSSQTTTINELPDFNNFMLGCYCLPSSPAVNLIGIANMQNYQWRKNGIAIPPLSGIQKDIQATDGSFELIAETNEGCIDSAGVIDIQLGSCENCTLNLSLLNYVCLGIDDDSLLYSFNLQADLGASLQSNYTLDVMLNINGIFVDIDSLYPQSIQGGIQTLGGQFKIPASHALDSLCIQVTASNPGVNCSQEICIPFSYNPCNFEADFSYTINPYSCEISFSDLSTYDSCMPQDSIIYLWTFSREMDTIYNNSQSPLLSEVEAGILSAWQEVRVFNHLDSSWCVRTICKEIEVPDCSCDDNCYSIQIIEKTFKSFEYLGDSCIIKFEILIDNPLGSNLETNFLGSNDGDVLSIAPIFSMSGNAYEIRFYPNQPWLGGVACFDLFFNEGGEDCCMQFCLDLPKCGCGLSLSNFNVDCTGPYGNQGDFTFNFLTDLDGSPGFTYLSSLGATLNGSPISIFNYQPSVLFDGSQSVLGNISIPNGMPGDTLCFTQISTLGGDSCQTTVCTVLPNNLCSITPSFTYSLDPYTCELSLHSTSTVSSCTYLNANSFKWTIGSQTIYGENVTVQNLPAGNNLICLEVLGINYTNDNDCHPDVCTNILIPDCVCEPLCSGISVTNAIFNNFQASQNPCVSNISLALDNPSGAPININGIRADQGRSLGISSSGGSFTNPLYGITHELPSGWLGGTVCFELFLNIDGEDCCIEFCLYIPACTTGGGGTGGFGGFRLTANTKNDSLENIELFPNPTSESITIVWDRAIDQKVDLRVLDRQGKMVKQKIIVYQKGGFNLDLSPFAEGIYILELQLEEHIIRKKIVLTNK